VSLEERRLITSNATAQIKYGTATIKIDSNDVFTLIMNSKKTAPKAIMSQNQRVRCRLSQCMSTRPYYFIGSN